jgi:hypothetical protein
MTGGTSKASSTKKKLQESERKSTPSSASEDSAMYLTDPESGINPPAVATTTDISSLTTQLQLLLLQQQEQQETINLLLKQQLINHKPTPTPTPTHAVPVTPSHSMSSIVHHSLKIELFGVPQPTSYGEAPKYAANTRFVSWEQKMESYAGTYGLDILITHSPDKSWADAVASKPAHIPLSTLAGWYTQVCKRLVHAIHAAIIDAKIDKHQLIVDAKSGKPDDGTVLIGDIKIEVDANPHLIMTTLRDKLDTRTQYAVLPMLKRLFQMRWNTSKTKASTHLQSVRDILTPLHRLLCDEKLKPGEAFGETLQAILILSTLPPDLETDVKILTAQERITLPQVEAVMRKHEDIELSQGKPSDYPEKANALTHSRSHSSYKNKKKGKHNNNKREQNRSNPDRQERSSRRRHDSSDGSSSESNGSGSDHEDDIETTKERAMCLFDASAVTSIARQHSGAAVLLDSAATRHVWNNTAAVQHQRDIKPTLLYGATGEPVTVTQKGKVRLTPTITLRGVIIAPTATANIMSVNRITKAGYNVSFYRKSAVIRDPREGKVILHFKKENGLYVLHYDHKKPPPSPSGRVNRKNKAEGS